MAMSQALASSLEDAICLANLPEKIRGYGHVREQHANAVKAERLSLRNRITAALPQPAEVF